MKKIFLIGLLASFLMAGVALASTVTVSAPWYRGEILTSFSDSAIETGWSYCVQDDVTITIGRAYEFSLVDVADYTSTGSELGYSAAWLIYDAYGYANNSAGNSIDLDHQKALQIAIWDVFNNETSYADLYSGHESTLSNLFDIVKTGENVQNLIIHNSLPVPVPVPATVWLFLSGLVWLIGFRRKRQSS